MDFPDTPLSEIDWDFVAVWRTVSAVAVCLFVLQMAIMLSHYWHLLMPLRKEIAKASGDSRVIAPPVVITFTYHCLVGTIIGLFGLGIAQSIYLGNKPTIATFVAPPILIALTIVVNLFAKYYSRTLLASHREQYKPLGGRHQE